jgi:opacity protein-like surface antigen
MGVLALELLTRPAQAEWYVAGQGGGSFPDSLSSVQVLDPSTGFPSGVTSSELLLHNSVMYGAKVGYYFDQLPWLGVEMEAFHSTPHVKQQTAILSSSDGSTLASGAISGQDLRVTNFAPVNIVVRYQKMGPLEPYAGIGLGVFFARIHDARSGESSSDNLKPGLNTQVGLRWRITKNLSLFGEWKYNHASLDFNYSTPTGAAGGTQGTYRTHIAAGGIGWHF